jgi:predicted KAP-like P-loop ATPase
MAGDKKQQYSADKAITSHVEDAYSRKGFAVQLANALADTELSGGYVVGLYSPWGYGKTSTLNMVIEQLETRANEKNDVVILKFNPWIFTTHENMVASLFNDLADSLGRAIPSQKEKIGSTIQKYAQAFQPLSASIPHFGSVGGSIVGGIGQLLSNTTLEQMKSKLESILKEAEKRVIVVIDDVDRLDNEEIFQLFKIIKIVIDFENISYVIAFDDAIVSKALSIRYTDKNAGRDFIDKIVQVPIHLPLIEPDVLKMTTLKGIDELLDEYKIEISRPDIDRFRGVFDKNIAPNIDSPRLVNRYLNSLRFVIPLVGSEINISDLLIIEGIRLISPESYNTLRTMKLLVTKGSTDFWGQDSPEELKKIFTERFKDTDPQIIDAIRDIFPVIENAMKDHGSSYIDHKLLRKDKRAASVDYFDRYFTYGIPTKDVSDAEILGILEHERKVIANELHRLIDEKDAHIVIKKLRQFEDNIKQGKEVALGVVSISDLFSDKEGFSFLDTDKEEVAKFLVVLCRNQERNRVELIKELISHMTDIGLISHFSKWIGIESEKDNDPLLNSKQYKSLFKPFAIKIKETILSSNKFLHYSDDKHATYLYDMWARGLSKADLVEYTEKYIKSSTNVEQLILTYTNLWVGGDGSHYANFDDANYRYLIKAFDADRLASILNAKYRFPEDVEWIGFDSHTYTPELANKDKEFRKIIAQQFIYHHNNTDENGNKI